MNDSPDEKELRKLVAPFFLKVRTQRRSTQEERGSGVME